MTSQEKPESTLRVLILTPELLSIGGIQRQNRLLIAALDALLAGAKGWLRVLALNDPATRYFDRELADLQVTSITCFEGHRLEYIRQALIESRKVDIVFYGLLGFTPISFVQKVLGHSNIRLLILYGIEAWSYRSFWHELSVKNMYGYIAISRYTLDRFHRAYKLDEAKPSFVLPNVVSPCLYESNHVPSTDEGEPRLLTICRLDASEKRKGVDSVIHALPVLIKQFPNLRYTIIGNGPDRLRLQGIAHDLQVEQYIDFWGYVSDEALKQAYHDCTVFILPSAKEGFGFVFIEAMAFGKPVIAARAGAASEVVEDGVTGFLIDYGNIEQLTSAITTLLSTPELRQRMGQAGIEVVRTRYSYAALKANLYKIFAACDLPLVPVRQVQAEEKQF